MVHFSYRHGILLWAMLCLAFTMQAQAPASYYQKAKGYSGSSLKTALYQIVSSHKQRSYKQLWEDFKTTDVRPDGKIWDMYSNATNFVPGKDQAGSYSGEGDVYNREHSFPKSWFDDKYPMYSDLFHLYPTDGYVNGQRSNYPFGETKGDIYQSKNGFSKLGTSTTPGYSGTVFEPNDEYKGDFARTYFYMATAYEDKIASWSSPMLAGNKYPAYAGWAVTLLLKWAAEDPVSEKEVARNNAVYKIQGNRNPYIDFPGLEQYVWGDKMSATFDPDNYGGEGPQPSVLAAPQFSPASGSVTPGTVVSITAASGATIHYVVNGGAEQAQPTPVSLTVNERTSVSAYATLGDERSETAEATYTLREEGSSSAYVYRLVTGQDALAAGQEALIVCVGSNVAMGASASNGVRNGAQIDAGNGQTVETEVNANDKPYTVTLGKSANAWTLYCQADESYLSLNSNGNKLNSTKTAGAPEAQWNITVDADGTATIASVKYEDRCIMYNSGSPRFACYRGNLQPVSLFVRETESGLQSIVAAGKGAVEVRNLYGHLVRKAATMELALKGLSGGIYIINGQKVLVR